MVAQCFNPLLQSNKPRILFRVEHSETSTSRPVDIRLRTLASVRIPPTVDEFKSHLQWSSSPTRFFSYFSNCERAMVWRDSLVSRMKKNIKVIAVKTENFASIYDAKAIASALGLDNLHRHTHEYLIEQYHEDECEILAVFQDDGLLTRTVTFFDVPDPVSIDLPEEYFPGKRTNDPRRDLEEEIHNRTGVDGTAWAGELIMVMARGPLCADNEPLAS
ncbi:hypothetical protein BDW59DRAFT_158447 [Aspergillus cavernicola]|uniref:DUF7587 domain-containing protein n=1 Tax=Aspergillus cavernicola TaxID=176166 RepID=A0ABR4IUL4_9EURO